MGQAQQASLTTSAVTNTYVRNHVGGLEGKVRDNCMMSQHGNNRKRNRKHGYGDTILATLTSFVALETLSAVCASVSPS
jgi:hypothetical protein